MKFLPPRENTTIITKLSPDEVVRLIKNNINQNGGIRKSKFSGVVSNDSFDLYRLGHNSFSPAMKGEIKDNESGSIIEVKIRIYFLVRWFMFFWFSIMFVSLGFMIFSYFTKPEYVFEYTILLWIIIPYLMMLFGFFYGSENSKNDLCRLIKGKVKK